MVDAPPTQDKLLQTGLRHYEAAEHRPNLTQTRAAFKTYSTYVLGYSYSSCVDVLTFSKAPAPSTLPGLLLPLPGKSNWLGASKMN